LVTGEIKVSRTKDSIRFVGTDVETTGLSPEKGDKITEIALVVYDYSLVEKKFVMKKTWSTLINPERSIPEKAQGITGITPLMVNSKPTFKHFAPVIEKVFDSADCFIAHNLSFDAGFLVAELNQAGYTLNMESEPFCTMDNGRFAKPLGEIPKLVDVCWSLNVDFDADAAHRADYDTEKMMEAFVIGCQRQLFKPDCLKGHTYE
jgi:DNA polymerase III subunit epsilon